MNTKSPLVLIVEDQKETAQNNCTFLQKLKPFAYCIITKTPEEALERLKLEIPELIVVDLCYGKIYGEKSPDLGLNLLKNIFEYYPTLNVLVYSMEPHHLIRLKQKIYQHDGGFAVVDKIQSREAFIEGAKAALEHFLYLPNELRKQFSEVNLDTKELEHLRLVCEECLKYNDIKDQTHQCRRTLDKISSELKMKLKVDQYYSHANLVALCREASKIGLISF